MSYLNEKHKYLQQDALISKTIRTDLLFLIAFFFNQSHFLFVKFKLIDEKFVCEGNFID